MGTRNETPAWLMAYGEAAARQDRTRKLRRRLALFDWDGVGPTTRWLDLACGHGEALGLLHERGLRLLTGIDLTRDETLGKDPRFRLLTGDATATGLPGGSFERVSCFHALHHLATPERTAALLNEASRLLHPEGELWILDFTDRLSVRLAFGVLRRSSWWPTPGLRRLALLVREEWPFLKDYLPRFGEVLLQLGTHPELELVRRKDTLFYAAFTLKKRKPRP